MKNNNTTQSFMCRNALIFATTAFLLVGCSTQKKKDTVVKEEVSTAATELGMQQEAIDKFQLAVTEIAKEKPDNKLAIDALTRSVELEPTFAEAHYNLGLIYTSLGQNDKAEQFLRSAKQIDSDVLDYTVALGRALAVNGKFDEAQALFAEVVAREPDNLNAINNLAVLSFRKGNNADALKHLQAILREDSENVAALTTLGQVYHKDNNLSLAKYIFNRAIKVDGKNPDLHNNLGLVYVQEEKMPEAVASFTKAVDSDPNYLQARLNLGTILLEYLDYQRAGVQFSEAVRIAPEHCVARLGNGAALYALGNHANAEAEYTFYTDRCDKDHVSSYERLAKLNESFLANPKKAITHYEKLVTLTKEKEKITQYNAMINFLKSQSNQKAPKEPEVSDETPEEGAE